MDSCFIPNLSLRLTWSAVGGRRDEGAAVLAVDDGGDLVVGVGVGGRLDDGARLGAAVVVGRVEHVRR